MLKALAYSLILAGSALLAAETARAEDAVEPVSEKKAQAQAEPDASSCHLNKPQDFAPREQIVSKRNADDYRRPTGVLARAEHEPVKVDPDEVHSRRIAMYEGKTFTHTPVKDTPRSYCAAEVSAAAAAAGAGEGKSSLVRGLLLGLPAVFLGVFLIWWMRQVKYAEVPKAQIVKLRQASGSRPRKSKPANGSVGKK